MTQRVLILVLSMLLTGTAVVVGPATAQEAPTYTVKSGDSLYRIAEMYGLTIDELKRLNELTGDLIRPGQELRLTPKVTVRPPNVRAIDARQTALASSLRGLDQTDTDSTYRPRTRPGTPALASVDSRTVRPGRSDTTAAADRRLNAAESMRTDLGERTVEAPPDPAFNPPFDRSGPALERAAEELAERIGTTTYTVREGETYYSIAADLGTKAYILYTLNEGIRESLDADSSIVVPEASGTPASTGYETYALGTVTLFPETYAGREMASGASYDSTDFIVAHSDLPIGTILIVENPETGRATFAHVADRDPSDESHFMVVSPAVASKIGIDAGATVRIRLVE